jgi:hypothetical protein
VRARKEVGGSESGDAATDDCCSHGWETIREPLFAPVRIPVRDLEEAP